jgi:hypothetical protein
MRIARQILSKVKSDEICIHIATKIQFDASNFLSFMLCILNIPFSMHTCDYITRLIYKRTFFSFSIENVCECYNLIKSLRYL